MPMQAKTSDASMEVPWLPLEAIHESKTNPRRNISADDIKELVENVKQFGILEPILVRPLNDQSYEIIAGARRYRAAKKAGLASIPVRVCPLSDHEVLEVQFIENLQRQDLHPMDEAVGFHGLVAKAGYDVPGLHAKLGKSETYIYQRLKLLDLIKPAQELFLKDEINIGHAILIARLQPKDQQTVLKDCYDRWGSDAKVMIPVKQLDSWIRQNILLDLQKVGFSKQDATLIPKAGACVDCSKRTGFNPSLFPDIQKKDLCTDPVCFHQKVEAFVQRRRDELAHENADFVEIATDFIPTTRQVKEEDKFKHVIKHYNWEKAGKQEKKKTKTGLVVFGPDAGKTMSVVLERDRQTSPASLQASPQAKAKEKKRREAERHQQRVRDLLYTRVTAKVGARGPEDLRLIALTVWERWWHDHKKTFCRLHGIEPKPQKLLNGYDYDSPVVQRIKKMTKEGEMIQFLVKVALLGAVDARASFDRANPDPLKAMAKRLGIDVAMIENEVKEKATKRATRSTWSTSPSPKTRPKPSSTPVKKKAKKKGKKK